MLNYVYSTDYILPEWYYDRVINNIKSQPYFPMAFDEIKFSNNIYKDTKLLQKIFL